MRKMATRLFFKEATTKHKPLAGMVSEEMVKVVEFGSRESLAQTDQSKAAVAPETGQVQLVLFAIGTINREARVNKFSSKSQNGTSHGFNGVSSQQNNPGILLQPSAHAVTQASQSSLPSGPPGGEVALTE